MNSSTYRQKQSDDTLLPFFVQKSQLISTNSFRLLRCWRSLSRFQRNIIIIIFLLTTIVTFSWQLRFPTSQIITITTINKDVPHRLSLNPSIGQIENDIKLENGEKQIVQSKYPKFSGPENDRQRAVVNAFKHAWKGYKTYAWGHDQLKPISRSYSEWFGVGMTIVDSLDTMLIMGLNDEFSESRSWVRNNLTFDKNVYVNLFETTIRVLGGLLSAYHLSGDRVFIDKADDLGARLIGAFDSPSPIPYTDVNLRMAKGKQPAWGGDSSLSEVTSIQLEFRDLSRLTLNPVYERMSFNISRHIHKVGCSAHDGLCQMFINPKTGTFKQGNPITFGARADSYYEYLLKQWLQTGKTIDWLIEDYKLAMTAMQTKLLRYSEPNKLTFIGELLQEKTFSPKMDHLVCFLSGTLALGAYNGVSINHLDIAKQLAFTCNQMYNNPTGLGPEIAHFNMLAGHKEDLYIKPLDAHCLLRPEAIESWFYLYRLTGDKIYQEWGWKAFEAIEKYARVEHGYSSVSNVKKIPVTHRDLMESFFLAETLKYLYLLFATDQTILPLNQYIFNTEGHPLPILVN